MSWYHWDHLDEDLLGFCRQLIAFRRAHPVFRRRRFFQGEPIRGTHKADIAWLRPDGAEMTDADWQVGYARSLAVFLNGEGISETDRYGQPVSDDSFLVLVNAHHETLDFTLPADGLAATWKQKLTTGAPTRAARRVTAGQSVTVADRSLEVWQAE